MLSVESAKVNKDQRRYARIDALTFEKVFLTQKNRNSFNSSIYLKRYSKKRPLKTKGICDHINPGVGKFLGPRAF